MKQNCSFKRTSIYKELYKKSKLELEDSGYKPDSPTLDTTPNPVYTPYPIMSDIIGQSTPGTDRKQYNFKLSISFSEPMMGPVGLPSNLPDNKCELPPKRHYFCRGNTELRVF